MVTTVRLLEDARVIIPGLVGTGLWHVTAATAHSLLIDDTSALGRPSHDEIPTRSRSIISGAPFDGGFPAPYPRARCATAR